MLLLIYVAVVIYWLNVFVTWDLHNLICGNIAVIKFLYKIFTRTVVGQMLVRWYSGTVDHFLQHISKLVDTYWVSFEPSIIGGRECHCCRSYVEWTVWLVITSWTPLCVKFVNIYRTTFRFVNIRPEFGLQSTVVFRVSTSSCFGLSLCVFQKFMAIFIWLEDNIPPAHVTVFLTAAEPKVDGIAKPQCL